MRAHGGASRTRCEICNVPQGKRHLEWCEHFKQRGGARVPGMTVAEARPLLSGEVGAPRFLADCSTEVIATEYPGVSEEVRQERRLAVMAQARTIERRIFQMLDTEVVALNKELDRALALAADSEDAAAGKNSKVETTRRELLMAKVKFRASERELQDQIDDKEKELEDLELKLSSAGDYEEKILHDMYDLESDKQEAQTRLLSVQKSILEVRTQTRAAEKEKANIEARVRR
jgi:hypothetical protein